MAKKGLAEEVFGVLAGHPQIRRIERSRNPCGGAKRRIKIVRDTAKVTLTITEPDFASSSIEIETDNVPTVTMLVEQYARRQKVDVLNK